MIALLLIGCFTACAYGRAPPLIIGGKNTTIEEHPHQVSFQVVDQHICGGSLIAPNIVVIAAHCTEQLAPYLIYLSVRAGSTIREHGGEVINVTSIHDHPKFNRNNSKDYDVSVLVLKWSFTIGSRVQPISLQPVNTEIPSGTLATVTGWGFISQNGPLSKILQTVDVPKLDQNMCQKRYPRETISNRMHCFGYEKVGKDTCRGDSGGPLVFQKKLIGIVSWGYICGDEEHPGVYTKVANEEVAKHINSVAAKFRKL